MLIRLKYFLKIYFYRKNIFVNTLRQISIKIKIEMVKDNFLNYVRKIPVNNAKRP